MALVAVGDLFSGAARAGHSQSWWQSQDWQAVLTASWMHPGYQHIQSFPIPTYVRSYHGHYPAAQGDAEWRKDSPRATENLIFKPVLEITLSRFYSCSVSPVYKVLTHPAGHHLLHFALTLELPLKELKHLKVSLLVWIKIAKSSRCFG